MNKRLLLLLVLVLFACASLVHTSTFNADEVVVQSWKEIVKRASKKIKKVFSASKPKATSPPRSTTKKSAPAKSAPKRNSTSKKKKITNKKGVTHVGSAGRSARRSRRASRKPKTSKPTIVDDSRFKADPFCQSRLGASYFMGENQTFTGSDHKTPCKVCTIDCASLWLFDSNFQLDWVANAPSAQELAAGVTKAPRAYTPTLPELHARTTCRCPYYNYGCQLETHCFSYNAAQELIAAIGFCVIHNGCKVSPLIKDVDNYIKVTTQLATMYAPNENALMGFESFTLDIIGARAEVIFHFKRIQDIKDAIKSNYTYEQFMNSRTGHLDFSQVPQFVQQSVHAFQVTEKLYNRVAQKMQAGTLDEDEIMSKVREAALKDIQASIKLVHDLAAATKLLVTSADKQLGLLEVAKSVVVATRQLLTNSGLSIFLTRETEEEELRIKQEREAERLKKLEQVEAKLKAMDMAIAALKQYKSQIPATVTSAPKKLTKKENKLVKNAKKLAKGTVKSVGKFVKNIGSLFGKKKKK